MSRPARIWCAFENVFIHDLIRQNVITPWNETLFASIPVRTSESRRESNTTWPWQRRQPFLTNSCEFNLLKAERSFGGVAVHFLPFRREQWKFVLALHVWYAFFHVLAAQGRKYVVSYGTNNWRGNYYILPGMASACIDRKNGVRSISLQWIGKKCGKRSEGKLAALNSAVNERLYTARFNTHKHGTHVRVMRSTVPHRKGKWIRFSLSENGKCTGPDMRANYIDTSLLLPLCAMP